MNVLLLSVKAGWGHHSTAQAMIKKFEEHGHACAMLDIFDYINHHLGNTIQDGYRLSTKLIPRAYGLVYDKMNKEEPYSDKSVTSLLSNIITKKLRGFVKAFRPDVIIATHSYAGVVATLLVKNKVAKCPAIGIVTDFTVHPFWESTNLDYYVIPDKMLSCQMKKKGIAREKLLPFGIPINEKFSKKCDKSESRKKLGIDDRSTVLVMMGSMGCGNVIDLVKEMDRFEKDFQILVVCGQNKKLKESMDECFFDKKVYTYGFVDNVDVMMDAADVIISKPGGLTTSETLAKGLPMITMNPLPGQEDKNLAFLVNNGAAMAVNSEFTIDEALYQLFFDDWTIERMKMSVDHIKKPNSAQDLYDFIIGLKK